MSSIDERVVKMEFDNSQFERGASKSMSTLERLKKSLNMDSATKSVSTLQKTANGFNLSGMATGVETIASRFTNLGIVGVTALQNITTAAMNTGAQMIKALTIDPIISGFDEYELKINSIKTILTNTASKGTTLDQVNQALAELNTYADQTIYNFGQMTENIGRFTAAGVDLDTSVSSIKGLANLAAASGSNATQAASAMYQLSQAIGAGTIRLQDWISVENAGMGGELFQNALMETARAHGVAIDEIIAQYGSFRASLTETGWLTTDILTETLEHFTGDLTKQELLAQGYTEAQADSIIKLGELAKSAAVDVKTVSQLISTTAENLQSGWATTWEYIIGNSEEATKTLTQISQAISGVIDPIADARNEMFKFWHDNGGRDAMIQALSNAFSSLGKVLGSIGNAFRDVFPAMTGERLVEITNRIKDLTEQFKLSDTTAENLRRTFRGLFTIVSLVGRIVTTVVKLFASLIGVILPVGDGILGITGAIGEFIYNLDKGISSAVNFDDAIGKIQGVLAGVASAIRGAIDAFLGFINTITGFDINLPFADKFEEAEKTVENLEYGAQASFGNIQTYAEENIGGANNVLQRFSDILNNIKTALSNFAGKIKDFFAPIGNAIKNAFESGMIGDAIDKALNIAFSVSTIRLMASISKVLSRIGDVFESFSKIGEGFIGVLDGVSDALQGLQNKLNAEAILRIAIAVGVLAAAVLALSFVDANKLNTGLIGVTVLLGEVITSMKVLDSIDVDDITKASINLGIIAIAITILASALKKLSVFQTWDQTWPALAAISTLIFGLTKGFETLAEQSKKLDGKEFIKTTVGLLLFAGAISQLAKAMKKMAEMDVAGIAKGLTTMGVLLLEIGVFIRAAKLDKLKDARSTIVQIAFAMLMLSGAVMIFGKLDIPTLVKGLVAVGVLLAGIALFLNKSKLDIKSAKSAVVIMALSASLLIIAGAFKMIASLSWEQITGGLTAMGGAMLILGGTLAILDKVGGKEVVIGAAAILIVALALIPVAHTLQQLGSMSWSEIAKGLVGMGGALLILGGISGALGMIASFSGLLGAGTILIAAQSLEPIAASLERIGKLTWGEIAKGLVGMGAALLELGVIAGLAGFISPLIGLGGGSLLIAVKGLGQLADALAKFGAMDWTSIGRGLAAMAGALGETALGGLLNTFSGFGAGAIAEMAPALGTLADSLSKWQNISVPTNLAEQLGSLADGVQKFTFAGFGSGGMQASIPALSSMADAVNKWKGVSIPQGIANGLTDLANGVKAFTFSGFGTSGLTTVIPAVSQLASAVSSWSGITIPEGLGGNLMSLALAVKAFGGDEYSYSNLSTIGMGLTSLSSGANTLIGIDFVTLSSNLTLFATTVTSIPSQLASATVAITSSVSGIASAIYAQAGTVTSAFSTMISLSIMTITASSGQFMTAGRTLVMTLTNAMISTLNGQILPIMSATTSLFNSVIYAAEQVINNGRSKLQNGGRNLIQSFIDGMNSNRSSAENTIRNIINSVVDSVSGYDNSFYNAGYNFSTGLANGISSGRSRVVNAARDVAQAAVNAANAALDAHSPSRVMVKSGKNFDDGFINGMVALISKVKSTAIGVASSATSGVKKGLSTLSSIINSSIDTTPVIRPVLDLSDIQSGSAVISGMFGSVGLSSGRLAGLAGRSMGINPTDTSYRYQTDNTDVVSAINNLDSRMDQLAESISSIKMVLNTGTLVGEMAIPMDKRLGVIASKKGRGI